MKAATKRHIKSGREYDHLFPAAGGNDITVKRGAELKDTLAFIPKVVAKTLHHTKGISEVLRGRNTLETCRKIWWFVYEHIAYKPDRANYEQVRSPARVWKDRFKGVDCDCYSTFISSILTNLGIPHKLRITKYRENHFQHIYPVSNDSTEIIIDCVTDQFDYEVPYSDKKDISMDLQYLDGLQGAGLGERGNDLVFDGNEDAVGTLGKFGFLKKIVKAINKVNPVTVVLRNGFLAAMKLNMFKVASRIKYAYLSPDAAVKRGIIKEKYDKLVKVKNKLESIFSTAGGNPKNLKNAILKGKGNKDKSVAVSGLGFLDSDASVMYMDSNTPLSKLLGPDVFYDENVRGMEGFEGLGSLGSLGELGAAPFIAAAAAAVGMIAKMLKGVGNIFGGKEKGSEDFAEGTTAAADQEIANTPAANAPVSLPAGQSAAIEDTSTETAAVARSSTEDAASTIAVEPVATAATTTTTKEVATSSDTPVPDTKEGFWTKNKKWLLPTVVVGGSIAVIAIGMKLMQSGGHHFGGQLHGIPKRKNYHRRKKQQHKKKTSISLL